MIIQKKRLQRKLKKINFIVKKLRKFLKIKMKQFKRHVSSKFSFVVEIVQKIVYT